MWLAQVGRERIEETIDPELTIDRALDTYARLGYKLRRKTHRLACGMKATFLCKTTFLLLDAYIDRIYNLCINQ